MEELEKEAEQIEFFGKNIKISDIRNPHLQRLLHGSKPGYNDWSRWSCHNDWGQWTGDYREKYHQYIDKTPDY